MTIPAPASKASTSGGPASRAERRAQAAPPRRGGSDLRRRLLKTVVPWALSIALVVATWGLTQLEKDEDARYDPFVTRAEVGEHAVARNIAVTVTDVHAARAVSDGSWRAEGTWLVVDLDAASTQDQFGAALRVTNLRIGERTYSATERGTSMRQLPLVTGVPQHGSLAFELPEDALKGQATLVFAENYDYAADGIIEIVLDLDDIAVEPEVLLDEIGWAE
ncbi:DUF4352 domain-containing protein [Microbacterium esteraromaticum]|uniref:DUF4352 domain-containing protein n=1 Tax=Microbacterium esteraromaticum TaxID=57043 RepID=A0A7D7WG11_9MICO|nr:hypothetical protein [Microbacterium esteraromaticum]QMU96393.1 DUF4352 domain-containing protein [Microbacterium esteraromaticum]